MYITLNSKQILNPIEILINITMAIRDFLKGVKTMLGTALTGVVTGTLFRFGIDITSILL